MEGESPRIAEEDNSQHLLEKSADAIHINDEPSINVSQAPKESVSEKSESEFADTKKKIKYQINNSRFAEARSTIDEYISQLNMSEVDINELSKVIKSQVHVLKKQFDFAGLGKIFISVVEPNLKKAADQKNAEAEARFLLVAQTISQSLQFNKDFTYMARMRDLRSENPESLIISKYLVKILLKVNSDGFLIEGKVAFQLTQEADEVNDHVLVKKFNYNKLTQKIQLHMIKHYDSFFTQSKFTQLTTRLMSTVGVKSIHTADVMTILADQSSKKGQQDKAVQYITRAHQIATEVLDGMTSHKKFIGILSGQATIAVRQKKYQEALGIVDKLEALAANIYGKNEALDQQISLRKFQVYSEMKGEEYKAEDYLKKFSKLLNSTYESLGEAKALSCLWLTQQSELMSGYIKLARPEKVQKLHAELQNEIKAKGLEKSIAHLTQDMMLIQSIQDPVLAQEHLAKVVALCEDVEASTKSKSLIGLYLRQHQIGQIFQVDQDFDLALKMTLQLVQDILEYFQGNEMNEILVDPYLIASSIYLQQQKVQESTVYLQKAEQVVLANSGEINDKMLEIHNQRIHLCMMLQQFEPAVNIMQQRNALALQIYGIDSEQYCEMLEEEGVFNYQMNRQPQALAIMQKLVRALKDIHGTENHQKVLNALEHIHDIHVNMAMYPEALLNVQQRISIYKALNGQEAEDMTIAKYLLQLGTIQMILAKFDDALRNYKASEKMIKKLGLTDPLAKAEEPQIKKAIEEVIAQQKKHENKPAAKAVQNKAAAPNSNLKLAMYVSICAAAAGLIAYAVMKKRN